jgi:hypothetical protein
MFWRRERERRRKRAWSSLLAGICGIVGVWRERVVLLGRSRVRRGVMQRWGR